MPHRIADLIELRPFRGALETLGYENLEQLIGVVQVAESELAAFLGIERTIFRVMINGLATQAEAIPAQALQTIRSATYPLGVALDRIPRPTIVPLITMPRTADQPDVNLVAEMPPIRNQQNRSTCVAFASLAAYEHLLRGDVAGNDLAEQFLYWNCKGNDGNPNQKGTFIGVAFPLLQRDGCCQEATWAYDPDPIPGAEGQGPPPAGAQLEALESRIAGFNQLAPTSVADIQNELARGRCVVFSIPVFNSWYRNTWVANTGDIGMPVPGESAVGGHAMCIVGYVSMPENLALDGGRFIIRNSWGQSWGIASPQGVGYGTLPYRYIRRFAQEAYSIA